MNTGVISSRYARALLLLTKESGRGEQVFEQARALLKDPSRVPEPLESDLARLVMLLRRNGRGEFLRFVLADYIRLWCKDSGAHLVHLTLAAPDPDLPPRIAALIGGKVFIDTEIDPTIEGGFTVILDDAVCLDASVRGQIEKIKRQFIERNSRLV